MPASTPDDSAIVVDKARIAELVEKVWNACAGYTIVELSVAMGWIFCRFNR